MANLITRAVAKLRARPANLSRPGSDGWSAWSGWWPTVHEPYAGAWQQNVAIEQTNVSAYWAVFACVTLIAKDISKLPAVVMQRDRAKGIFVPTAHRPVLRKPNHYQTRLEFFFCWVTSLLLHGNTYVLKMRDPATGFISKMFVLDPCRVTVLVAEDGSVYYELRADHLAELGESSVVVPASEIIHDRMYTLYHPLIGVSPIYACGIAAVQGAAIQNNSSKFFGNMSRPSGLLTAPGSISNETATRLKTQWETNYSASNIGRVAVLGDGLKYEAMTVTASDAQLIEQLKFTGEMICACFHVPGYKIGVGPMPTVNNTATLNQQYYDQCLQYIIEKMEQRLDEGLEVEPPFETWFDLNALLRMDPSARYDSHNKAIAGGWMSPNEARREEDMPPVPGGDTPYMQQQNYSLAALDERDRNAPFAKPAAPPAEGQGESPAEDDPGGADGPDDVARAMAALLERVAQLEARPSLIDCGVYREGETYRAGGGVTHAGSFWIAQRETSAKPGDEDSGWRLAVKRGRDGSKA